MNPLIPWIWACGAMQILDAAANLVVPRKIQSRENLGRVTPIFRQVFLVHWFYVVVVLVIFGVACLLFAPELAGGGPLGRFLSSALAVFWLSRVLIQRFYFDSGFKQRNRLADVAFTLGGLFMGAVFTLAALGRVR